MASVLAAVTVYPGAANAQTGATCLQLCPGGPGTCAGHDSATACQASSRDVRSLSDFTNAAAGLMVSNGLAIAAGQPPSFTAPTIAAASEIEVVARFSLAPAQMLRVMRQLASGRPASFSRGGRRASPFPISWRERFGSTAARWAASPSPGARPPGPGTSRAPLQPAGVVDLHLVVDRDVGLRVVGGA